MKKRFSFSKLSVLVASFGVLALCSAPAAAQRSSGPRATPVPPRAAPAARQTAPVQTRHIDHNQVRVPQGGGHGGHYSKSPGYCPPTYPGPNVPLPPQGSYYVPNPYYGYGYGQGNYNNGGYYNNGYYNNSYYNNGYYNNGYNGGGVNQGQMTNFPPFQGY